MRTLSSREYPHGTLIVNKVPGEFVENHVIFVANGLRTIIKDFYWSSAARRYAPAGAEWE